MKLNLFAADIAARLNGRLMGENVHINGHLKTDSRAIEAGDVFVALRGERFDGHDYLADVEAAQATLLVVSAPSPSRNVTQIVVEDTLRAYGQLAGIVRDQFSGAVFGVE
jgi:UDP-N-acetylmuramoyl-tripeptide--D-alanyl-D-alanine ligase